MNNISQWTTGNRQQSLFTSYRRFIALGSWLLALILIVSSCSVKKETSNLRMLSANHIVKEVGDKQFEFDNLEAKFDVKIKNEMDLKGQLRMQNDSLIWISISLKLGVEVTRVMITEDSLKFINRTNKTYFATNIKDMDTIVENPLQFIQGLLVGNDIHIKDNKYQVEIENDRYKLETKEELITKNIYISPETFKISKYEINNYFLNKDIISQSVSSLSYNNFQNINDKLIPSKIIFETSLLDGKIEINYTEIKVGEKLLFPFNISNKYRKTNLW